MPEEREEAVKVIALEEIKGVDPETWPTGDLFLRGLQSLGITLDGLHEKDPNYWQAFARWALLKKYGYLSDTESDSSWCFRPDFMPRVSSLWMSSVVQLVTATTEEKSNLHENDLLDFLRQRGRSRGRWMQFDVMDCAPGCQFNLHAHPNLELVYCARGELHEVRMDGPPVPNQYEPHPTQKERVKGPNLSYMRRPWKFGTLREGNWLVNEAGSIHKSFTATSGKGCLLVTLWSGSHANILEGEEPVEPNVQDAVDRMDKEIERCECKSDWQSLEQTFLPASERRK